jgi:hypothetical protein
MNTCLACGGTGSREILYDMVVVVEDCDWCDGTGLVERGESAASDSFCDEHGHAPDCPHDPTDWDARYDDIRAEREGRL